MENEEFLKYVNVVIEGNYAGCMEVALEELRRILKRNGAEKEKLDLLKDLSSFSTQLAKMKKKKPAEELTMEGIAEVIREGNEWVREMQMMR